MHKNLYLVGPDTSKPDLNMWNRNHMSVGADTSKPPIVGTDTSKPLLVGDLSKLSFSTGRLDPSKPDINSSLIRVNRVGDDVRVSNIPLTHLPAIDQAYTKVGKKLQVIQSQLMTVPTAINEYEKLHQIENIITNHIPIVSDYLNHLAQKGFVYHEISQYTERITKTTFFTKTQHIYLQESGSSRTRVVAHAVARYNFAWKLHEFLTSATCQSSGAVKVGTRDLPEDSLEQVVDSVFISNTEMTQGADVSTPQVFTHGPILQEQTTTDPIYNYPLLTERMFKVGDFHLSTTDEPNQELFSMSVPNGLYDVLDTTTAALLRPFTLMSCDVEFNFKVNANQAQCGSYVVSHLAGGVQYPQVLPMDSVYRNLTREHAMMDIALSNDVKYHIPYEHVRPWIPIQSNEVGLMTGGSFARISVKCLVPLRIAEIGNNQAHVQVFARLVNVKLVGMRHPVAAQSGNGDEIDPQIPSTSGVQEVASDAPLSSEEKPSITKRIGNAFSAIQSVLTIGQFITNFAGLFVNPISSVASLLHPMLTTSIEKTMNYFGGYNKDHPAIIKPPEPLLPQATHSFANSIGGVPLRKLRIEPTSNTPQFREFFVHNTPTSLTQIAEVPGFYTSFEVSTSNQTGDLLVELPVMPLDPRYPMGPVVQAPISPEDDRLYHQQPPVWYIMNMFTDYIGALEYEFYAVKTPAHNFSMQAAFVPFNGTPGTTSMDELQSCRWETIDMRVNNRVKFPVPFISTNLMRQYAGANTGAGQVNASYLHNVSQITPSDSLQFSNNIANTSLTTLGSANSPMRDPGKVVVRMLNTLNPTPIVSTSITVVVFVRAQPGWKFLVPRPLKGKPAVIPRYPTNMSQGAEVQGSFTAVVVNNVIPVQSFGSVQVGDEMTVATNQQKKLFGTLLNSMECHDNIINLCRRTYFYTALRGTYFAFSANPGEVYPWSNQPIIAEVPVTPYAWPTQLNEITTGTYRPQDITVGSTNPRDALLYGFRWMRGSLNYTIYLHPENGYDKQALAVTHMPPGNFPTFFSAWQQDPVTTNRIMNPAPTAPFCGYGSELIVPSVNPVVTVEIPYYAPTNYIDLMGPLNNNRGAQYIPFNDLSTWTLGQLQLSSLRNTPVTASTEYVRSMAFQATLLSTFADDTLLEHFIGFPPITTDTIITNMPIAGGLNRTRTRAEIETDLVRGGVEKNPGPVVTPGTSTSDFTPSSVNTGSNNTTERESFSWWQSVKDFVKLPTHIKHLATSIDRTTDAVTAKLDEFKQNLLTFIPDVTLLQVSTVISAVISAYAFPSVLTAVTAALSFLSLFPVFCKNVVDKLITKCISLFRPTVESGDIVKTQAFPRFDVNTSSVIAVFTSLLIEGLIVSDKVGKMDGQDGSVKDIVTRHLSAINFARTGAVCVLMYRVCLIVESLWSRLGKWCSSYKTVSLLEVDQTFIDDFMANYEYLMAEINVDVFNFTKINRDRYWTTVVQAYYLQNIMVKYKSVNPILKTACTAIITRANTLNARVTAPPVRYEPFVLWMYGEPGVGKSTVGGGIVIEMARNIGVTYPADPVYVINPTSQYMNGLTRQPIIVIDDAGAVSDSMVEPVLLSNYMAMKSCARMLVDKPRVEDKEAELSSCIVGIWSNYKYWPVENSVRNKNALDRRRDVLVKCSFSQTAVDWFTAHPEVARLAQHLPKELMANNDHLLFEVRYDKLRHGNHVTKLSDPPRSYAAFMEFLLLEHKKYHEAEKDKMLERYRRSLSLARNSSQNMTDAQSLRVALATISIGADGDDSDVPMETLRHTLLQLKNTMPEYYNSLPESVQRPLEFMSNEHASPQGLTQMNFHIGMTDLADASPYVQALMRRFTERNPNIPTQTLDQRAYEYLSGDSCPWGVQATPVESVFTTPCTACMDEANMERRPAYLCRNSTIENQHWYCKECSEERPQECGQCRADNMIPLARLDTVNFWKKAWYWMKLGGRLLTRGATVVVRVAVIAMIIAYVMSIVTFAGVLLGSMCDAARNDTDVRWYIQHTGEIPEYLGRTDEGNPMYKTDVGVVHRVGDALEPLTHAFVQSGHSEDNFIETEPVFPVTTETSHICQHMDLDFSTPIENAVLYDEERNIAVCQFYTHGFSKQHTAQWVLMYCQDGRCRLRLHYKQLVSMILDQSATAWRNDPTLIPPMFKVTTKGRILAHIRSFSVVRDELIGKIRNVLVPRLVAAYIWVRDYLYYIASFIAILLAFYFGYRVVYSKEDGYVTECQSGYGHSQVPFRDRRPNTRTVRVHSGDSVPQPVMDTQRLVENNLVQLKHCSTSTYAIGLYNSTVIVPRHSYKALCHLEGDKEVIVTHKGFTRYLTIKDLPCQELVEIESVLLQLPSCFSFRNITRQFNDCNEDTYTIPSQIFAYSVSQKAVTQHQAMGTVDNITVSGGFHVQNRSYTYTNVVPSTFIIDKFQRVGDCISPMIDAQGRIVALHIAGTEWANQGYSVPVYRHVFEAQVQSLGSMEYVRTVEDAPFHTFKSKIVPSKIASVMHVSITEPCVQSRSDVRVYPDTDPLIEGCKTIGAETNPPDAGLLEAVEDAVFDNIINKMPVPFSVAPVSDDVAVKPSVGKLTSIDLSTSSGYPLCNKHTKKNEIVKIHANGQTQWIKSDVRREMQRALEDRLEGKLPPVTFWAHLKDERRIPTKARSAGGTRVFHVAPFEFILNVRRIMLPFIEAHTSDPVGFCHGIGLVPESIQWAQMLNAFTKKGSCYLQLDFSKFSDSMPHEFAHSAFNLIRRWYDKHGLYNEGIKKAIDTIETQILFSETLVYSDVYRISNGVLQGHPLTATLNSLVNILEQVYVYSRVVQEMPFKFFEDCKIMVMGDDVVISVPKQLAEVYNAKSVIREFAEMKIKVTDPFDKTLDLNDIPPYYPLSKVLFLSRSVHKHPYRSTVLLAPIKIQSMVDTPLWTHGSDRDGTKTKEVIRASLILAFSHGLQFYNMFRQYIEIVCEASDFELGPTPSWIQLDHLFFGPYNDNRPVTVHRCKCVFKCWEWLSETLVDGANSSNRKHAAVCKSMLRESGLRFVNSVGDSVVPELGHMDITPPVSYSYLNVV